MRFKTIEDATRAWVGEFNTLPYSLIERAYKDSIDDLHELTVPTIGDRVWSDEHCQYAEVIDYYVETETYELLLDNGKVVTEIDRHDIYIEHDSWLPAWGWLWYPSVSLDEDWIRDNIFTVSSLGFRIFETDEIGIFIGIDGAGYDFYSEHWIPLYKARGLQWHEID